MDKKTTIYDIAKIANVSPATVSRVIHDPDCVKETTRQKVWKAFQTAGTTPELLSFRKTVSKQKKTAGIPHVPTILVCLPGWDNPFYHDVLDGLQAYLHASGYEALICTPSLNANRVHEFLEFAASAQASGLITMIQLSADILYRLKSHYPLVQCSEYNPLCPTIPSVSVDDYTISREAVTWLVEHGGKNIGFFTAPYQNRYVQNRFLAYQDVLRDSGRVMQPEYVLQVSDFSYDRILAAADRFFMMPEPPDCIFAVSDKHAHAIIKAAQHNGFRVPDDMRVIGFDDTMYATLSTPTITTVRQPRRELGSESARLLLSAIQGKTVQEQNLLLPTKIMWREST